jgi:hypothetical protein
VLRAAGRPAHANCVRVERPWPRGETAATACGTPTTAGFAGYFTFLSASHAVTRTWICWAFGGLPFRSGRQHRVGRAGPNNFGQAGVKPDDPRHNIDAALERWVEHGTAPSAIVAWGAERPLPLCPYPQTAHYTGTGSTDEAANFVCK